MEQDVNLHLAYMGQLREYAQATSSLEGRRRIEKRIERVADRIEKILGLGKGAVSPP